MWSDRETIHDCLGFGSYVDSLAAICLEPEIAPLTLGIFGSWGSGKTSLMKMLEAKISSQPKVKTVWANAWRYEGKDEIQSALIHAILAKLNEDKSLLNDAKDVLERLKKGASVLKLGKFIGKTLLTMSPDIGAFIDCFNEESAKLAETMAQFEKDFESLLRKVDIDRVVVFIDDLDRCQSAKVVETFETIKLFLDIPECTFVIGADATKIEHAVGEHYRFQPEQGSGRTFAEDYLEKIVQIPFRLPEQQLRDIACYVGMLNLKGHLTPEAWQKLIRERPIVAAHQTSVYEGFVVWLTACPDNDFNGVRSDALRTLQRSQQYVSILAQGLRGNPRQIKRFLNILELRLRLARANNLAVAEDILTKVLVLEYAWRWFFQDVADSVDPDNGRSELLYELVRFHGAEKPDDPESSMLTKALSTSGLPEFLKGKPALHDVDLRPYLFLAQTALHVRPVALAPPDEAARALAERIADADRLRSKAAAREACKADGIIAVAVIRALNAKLIAERDARIQVHIVNGLTTICPQHPSFYPIALDGLSNMDVAANEALAIAAQPLIEGAAKTGLDVSALRTRLGESSKFAKALGSLGMESIGAAVPRKKE